MITHPQYQKFTKLFNVILCNILVIVFLLSSQTAYANRSLPTSANNVIYPKLPGSSIALWVFYDDLNTNMGITNSGTVVVDALQKWETASWYTVFDLLSGGANTQATNTIKAIDFLTAPSTTTICANVNLFPRGVAAITCPPERVILFNLHPTRRWNTSGTWFISSDPNCQLNCYNLDVMTILLHELGHFHLLAHPSNPGTSDAVMISPLLGVKQNLREDDKRGATQFYGPETGWETNLTFSWFPGYTYYEAEGKQSVVALNQSVAPVLLLPIGAENSVTPFSGSRQLKLYGSAGGSYSYLYMKLFSANDDELFPTNHNHLTIANGMVLSWYQYNHTQTRMSVDILFADGSTLRDSGLTDQYGVNVHPKNRGGYTTGQWRFFQVNLSSLAGKKVKDIMMAYDNDNNGVTGIFRSYFDNLSISY